MKKLSKVGMYGLMAGLLSAGIAFAAPGDEEAPPPRGERGQRPDPAERFAAMDTDKSGDISKAEFKLAHEKRAAAMKERRGDRQLPEGRTPPTAEEVFTRLDTNKDNVLTKEELAAARRGQRGEGRQRGPGAGQRGPGGGGQGGGGPGAGAPPA